MPQNTFYVTIALSIWFDLQGKRVLRYLSWDTVQRGLFHRRGWVRGLTILAICLVAGVPVGAVLGLLGGLYGSAALIGLAAAYLILRIPMVGLFAVICVICLLPFAALPVDIGFTPTFLDLALLGLFFVWISRLVTAKDAASGKQEFITTSPTLAVILFVLLAIVSFIAGLSHSTITANLIRHFGEILLSVLLFLLVINMVRTQQHLRTVTLVLILAGFGAAAVGVFLYVLPDELTVRLLSALRVFGYPSGHGVLRYIEENSELPLRATSTSVDPNVLGGLLIFVTTLTITQVLARKPIIRRGWLIGMAAVMLLCLILTYSRGAFVGFAAAAFLLGILRYPKVLGIVIVVCLLLLLLPPAQFYVQHFTEGVQGQDQATQMRFGEYKDALILISRYPWFGVGFAGAPDIDTYLGVSNVYLLIGEEMGLVGLGGFLLCLGVFFFNFFVTRPRCPKNTELESLFLGPPLAVAGALVGGIFDHYLFNLDFPHAAGLFWLMVGLGTVGVRLVQAQQPATAPVRQGAAADESPSGSALPDTTKAPAL